MKKLFPAEEQRLVDGIKKGLTADQLSFRSGMAPATIRNFAKKNNLYLVSGKAKGSTLMKGKTKSVLNDRCRELAKSLGITNNAITTTFMAPEDEFLGGK